MSDNTPYITILAYYILSFHILSINSRTSTLWKLNSEESKIVEVSPFHQVVTLPGGLSEGHLIEDDPVFNIITSTVHFGQFWSKQGLEYYCTDCSNIRNNQGLSEKYVKTHKYLHNLNIMIIQLLLCIFLL